MFFLYTLKGYKKEVDKVAPERILSINQQGNEHLKE